MARKRGSSLRAKLPVFIRDDWQCQYCGKDLLADVGNLLSATVDHVVPACMGGTGERDNLAACCDQCNSLKGDIPTYSVEEGRKVVQYKRTALLKTLLPVLEQAGQIFPRVDPCPAEFHQPGMIVDARTAFPSLPAREVFRLVDEEGVATDDVLVAGCLATW